YLHVPPTVVVATDSKSAHQTGKETAPAKTVAGEADESAGNDAPATDLPLDDDALGEDPALAEKWEEVAGAEGGRAAEAAVERIDVPDFTGMSLGQAIHAAHKSGVELAFDDPEGRASGVALRQRP